MAPEEDRHARVTELFAEVCELPARERRRVLELECGGRPRHPQLRHPRDVLVVRGGEPTPTPRDTQKGLDSVGPLVIL